MKKTARFKIFIILGRATNFEEKSGDKFCLLQINTWNHFYVCIACKKSRNKYQGSIACGFMTGAKVARFRGNVQILRNKKQTFD